jgi:hypothetical protein
MAFADLPDDQRLSERNRFKVEPFDPYSAILSAQIGVASVPICLVAFGLAPAAHCRLDMLER